MNEWVKANERQPDGDVEVLIFSKMGGIDVGSWSGREWYDAHGTFVAGVTHWMALPDEPERQPVTPRSEPLRHVVECKKCGRAFLTHDVGLPHLDVCQG